VIGIAGVSPPMLDVDGGRAAPVRPTGIRKLKWIVRRLPHLPAHLVARLRYGPPDAYRPIGDVELGALRDPAGLMRSIVRRTPLWILCGADDGSTPALRKLAEELRDEPRFELEVAEGVVYMSRTPATAAMRIRRSIEWARACLAPMEVSA
jgi:hypothetical protein